MDIIRRSTDYALRLMVNLARSFGKAPVSARALAGQEEVSYQLACKLLQKLNAAGLVKSRMGSEGGFFLAKRPSRITAAEIIEVVQGPVSVNRCLLGIDVCPRQPGCTISKRLEGLQEYIENFLSGITLDQLLKSKDTGRKNNTKKLGKRKS